MKKAYRRCSHCVYREFYNTHSIWLVIRYSFTRSLTEMKTKLFFLLSHSIDLIFYKRNFFLRDQTRKKNGLNYKRSNSPLRLICTATVDIFRFSKCTNSWCIQWAWAKNTNNRKANNTHNEERENEWWKNHRYTMTKTEIFFKSFKVYTMTRTRWKSLACQFYAKPR